MRRAHSELCAAARRLGPEVLIDEASQQAVDRPAAEVLEPYSNGW